jgi:hypothetical protein
VDDLRDQVIGNLAEILKRGVAFGRLGHSAYSKKYRLRFYAFPCLLMASSLNGRGD